MEKKVELKFEDKMNKLQDIVSSLEKEDIDLDTSLDLYQEGLILSKQLKDELNQFDEKMISEIRPLGNTRYNKGIHTINGNETITVIDAKRFIFTLRGFFQQLKVKLKKS